MKEICTSCGKGVGKYKIKDMKEKFACSVECYRKLTVSVKGK